MAEEHGVRRSILYRIPYPKLARLKNPPRHPLESALPYMPMSSEAPAMPYISMEENNPHPPFLSSIIPLVGVARKICAHQIGQAVSMRAKLHLSRFVPKHVLPSKKRIEETEL